MKNTLMILVVSLLAGCGTINELSELDKRVKSLEKTVTRLESSTAPLIARAELEQRIKDQRLKARDRMLKDSSIYSREQLQEIEKLYQVANRKWRSKEGKDSLEKLISKYDKANRTGCALLVRGGVEDLSILPYVEGPDLLATCIDHGLDARVEPPHTPAQAHDFRHISVRIRNDLSPEAACHALEPAEQVT